MVAETTTMVMIAISRPEKYALFAKRMGGYAQENTITAPSAANNQYLSDPTPLHPHNHNRHYMAPVQDTHRFYQGRGNKARGGQTGAEAP